MITINYYKYDVLTSAYYHDDNYRLAIRFIKFIKKDRHHLLVDWSCDDYYIADRITEALCYTRLD